MAERGMISKWFAYIHPKYKTPTNAILFLGALAFFAPLLGRPASCGFSMQSSADTSLCPSPL